MQNSQAYIEHKGRKQCDSSEHKRMAGRRKESVKRLITGMKAKGLALCNSISGIMKKSDESVPMDALWHINGEQGNAIT